MAREKLGPTDAKIGSYLHQLRVTAGFSEEQVAQVLGITQQLVSRQERGRSRLSIGQLLRLAAFYGRTLAQLMAEVALDQVVLSEAREPEALPYEAGLITNNRGADNGFAQEPFLLNLAQLRDPAERQAVLDLFNRFLQQQNG